MSEAILEAVESSKTLILNYQASATLQRFHHDDGFARFVLGPVGSGKTVALGCAEVIGRAMRQRPFNGVRYSRCAVIRNTYEQLQDTTIKTWEEWVPSSLCLLKNSSPVRGLVDRVPISIGGDLDQDEIDGISVVDGFPLGDGTTLHLEMLFLALDKIKDLRKLKSLELTFAFLNEVVELPKEVVTMLARRVGRYPAKKMGGASWWGIWGDTNAPPVSHWYYELAEEEQPEGWSFYRQPGALIREQDGKYVANPLAENISNLPGATPEHPEAGYQYYYQGLGASTQEEINVYVLAQYGQVFSGRPVYEGHFLDSMHVSETPIGLYRGLPLRLSWDFGLTPACLFSQVTPNGVLQVLWEEEYERGGIRQFATDVVKPVLANQFQGLKLSIGNADPAGDTPGQEDEQECIAILKKLKLPTQAASTNEFVPRRQAVIDFLNRMVDGKPGFRLDKSCKRLRQGFNGGYQFSKIQAVGSTTFRERPDKNEFSHLQDCLQYDCLDILHPQTTGRRGAPGVSQRNPWARRR